MQSEASGLSYLRDWRTDISPVLISVLVLLSLFISSPASGSDEVLEFCDIERTMFCRNIHEVLDGSYPCTSRFASSEIRDEAARQLMVGFQEGDHDKYWYWDLHFDHYDGPWPITVNEFEQDTNFVLIEFIASDSTQSPGPYGTYFFGYIKPTGKLYLLADGFGSTVEECFNTMVKESGGIPNLPPVCRATLLLKLKYRLGTFAVVFDQADADLWYSKLYDLGRCLSSEWRKSRYLIEIAPAHDEEYVRCVDSLHEAGVRAFTSQGLPMDSASSTNVELAPPTLSVMGDTCIVRLSVCVFLFSDRDVATWEIRMSKDGYVLSMDYVSKPINRLLRELRIK
jgi:hypothetical protein